MPARPPVLSIAGSDNSAGAGIQADLKTFSAHGCYGLTAVTCVVAEVPGLVSGIQSIRPAIVAEQVALSFKAFPVAAIKTGMLFSTPIIRAVADVLRAQKKLPPIVVDPVMVASSGDPLLKPSAIAAYKKQLFPLATLLTPNLDELGILTNSRPTTLEEMEDAGHRLAEQTGSAVLCKGGHLPEKNAVDILIDNRGQTWCFEAPRIRNISTHGTGCTYASAITANLARGVSLPEAVRNAKAYLTAAIHESHRWGGTHALEHFPRKD